MSSTHEFTKRLRWLSSSEVPTTLGDHGGIETWIATLDIPHLAEVWYSEGFETNISAWEFGCMEMPLTNADLVELGVPKGRRLLTRLDLVLRYNDLIRRGVIEGIPTPITSIFPRFVLPSFFFNS